MDNVLLSPHIAGWTVESKKKLVPTIVENTETFSPKNNEKPSHLSGIILLGLQLSHYQNYL